MKSTIKLLRHRGWGVALLIGAAITLGSCAKEMPSEPSTAVPQSLEGKWAYQSTDGQNLSGYGITYQFQGTTWTYTLGTAGTKQYDFATSGNSFTATLRQNGVNSGEQAGSQITGQYKISGDTLNMISGGHTAVLVKE